MGQPASSCENKRYDYKTVGEATANVSAVISTQDEEVFCPELTYYGRFLKAAEQYPADLCLGWREIDSSSGVALSYVWLTYCAAVLRLNGIITQINQFKENLKVANDPLVGEIKTVGILASNSVEWILSDLACSALSFTLVPLYPTLGKEAMDFIVDQCNINLLIVHENQLSMIAKSKTVTHLIVIPRGSQVSDESKKMIAAFEWVPINRESQELDPSIAVNVSNLDVTKTICYTSGTTGALPKGVVITERNMMWARTTLVRALPLVERGDIHISYLPLSHIYEQMNVLGLITSGGSVGVWQGELPKLMDDVKTLRPTIFTAVPRLLSKIYSEITGKVAEKPKPVQYLIKSCLDAKLASKATQHWAYDYIFADIRGALGGRVKAIVCASAALDKRIQRDLAALFSCPIYQAYGMTETCGALCVNRYPVIGNVGGLVPSADMRIVSWEGYQVQDGKGEIQVRHDGCTSGYFKNPEATRALISDKGWIRTGDVVHVNDKSEITIIDRTKNLLKLSQGEYVSPEKIENVLGQIRYVEQICVDAISSRSSCIAIVWPCPKHKREMGQDPEQFLLAKFESFGKKSGLLGYEIPKAIVWADELFSVANGLLTPTAKIRRGPMKALYKDRIETAYEILDAHVTHLSTEE